MFSVGKSKFYFHTTQWTKSNDFCSYENQICVYDIVNSTSNIECDFDHLHMCLNSDTNPIFCNVTSVLQNSCDFFTHSLVWTERRAKRLEALIDVVRGNLWHPEIFIGVIQTNSGPDYTSTQTHTHTHTHIHTPPYQICSRCSIKIFVITVVTSLFTHKWNCLYIFFYCSFLHINVKSLNE